MDERRAVVMGLGSFGGGAGAVRYLASRGWDVLLTDMSPAEKLADALASIRDLTESGAVTLRLGEHNVSDFTTSGLVVVNPAVKKPWENRFVRAAQASGARVTTEIGLAIDHVPETARAIGITGSAGKSTTSAMTHAGLTHAGIRSVLGGNIGGSLLAPGPMEGAEAVVLELSSAMLWWLAQEGVTQRPRFLDIALVTNITPNHADWHGSIEHYAESKLGIARMVRGTGPVLTGPGADIPNAISIGENGDLPTLATLATPGAHNRANAHAALLACTALGADPAMALAGIAKFPGLPHRLELVREIAGVRWYNDSKSTTPEATRLALEALAPARTHLIVGGSDKGIDLAPIARLTQRGARLWCIGQTGGVIAKLAGVGEARTLAEAVRLARAEAKPGEAVALSPGCASFDQFRSYEDRGNRFRSLVEALE